MILCLLTVFYFAFSMFVSELALFLAARFTWHDQPFGPREVGAVFSFAGLISLIVQMSLTSRLNRVLTDKVTIVGSFLLLGFGYAGLGVATSVVSLMLLFALSNIGSAVLRPTLLAELSRRSPDQHQGVIMGVSQSLMAATSIVAPLASGFLIEHGFYALWAFAIASIVICGASLAIG
jgi:MFS family permease